MKKFSFFPLLLILSAALYYYEGESLPTKKSVKFASAHFYKNGILSSEYSKVDRRASYNFDVSFNEITKTIFVKERIEWINKTKIPASEIQLHMYPNAYKSNNTIYAKAYHLKPENKTEVIIETPPVQISHSQAISAAMNFESVPNPSVVAKYAELGKAMAKIMAGNKDKD